MIIAASEGQGIWCKEFLQHITKGQIVFEKSQRTNLIIRSLFLGQESVFPAKLPYISWSGEPLDVPSRGYEPIFRIWSTISAKSTDFQIPFFIIVYFDYRATFGYKYNLENLKLYDPLKERPYFLAYCASRATPTRETLFSLLKARDKTGTAHGLGACQTTPGFRDDKTFHNLVHTYSNYRFALAMENCVMDTYVTEKLLNVMLSGAIPIYYGDSKWVKRMFTTHGIIFVDDFDSLESCADYIVHVDNTPALLDAYRISAHKVRDEALGYFSDTVRAPEYEEMERLIKTTINP